VTPLPAELTSAQWLQSIWAALRRIEDNLALPPAPLELPAVTVAPPDLTDIVTAVQSLGGTPGPTADDIARAIADVFAPARPDDAGEALRAVAKGLEMLDHRLQGLGKQAYGGGSVTLLPNQTVGVTGQPNLTGTWGYHAGVSGTVVVAAGERVVGIAAHATDAGSMTIDGGDSVPVPAGTGVVFTPQGNLVAPTIVFTGTDSYVVETLT
jgi:hypothetical protein